jgi:hypothetical protein
MRRALQLLAVSALIAGCGVESNPDYCPGAPHDRCSELSDGMPGGDLTMAPACKSAQDCNASLPACMGGTCVGCRGGIQSTDCAAYATTPHCGPMGACVECLAKEDCATAGKACGPDNKCAPCKTNFDCATGVCLVGGACARGDQVTFVDNRGMKPADCKTAHPGADGTTAVTAFCDIPDALAKPRDYIAVRGSAEGYGDVDLSVTMPAKLVLVGPGKDAAVPARIVASDVAAVNVVVNGNAASLDLTLDGLDLKANSVNKMPAGVQCLVSSGAASLTIRDSNIHDSADYGISITGCQLKLDRSRIAKNLNGGVSLAKSAYSITNSFILSNSTAGTGQGVSIDTASQGAFAFNTVVANGMTGFIGAITCGFGQPKIIESSIVVKNAQAAGTQFAPGCHLVNVVTGSDVAQGAIMLSPQFVNDSDGSKPFDYHLVKGSAMNAACCVDKVSGMSDGGMVTLTDHDVDNSVRPQGMGYDIGAHEVQ